MFEKYYSRLDDTIWLISQIWMMSDQIISFFNNEQLAMGNCRWFAY